MFSLYLQVNNDLGAYICHLGMIYNIRRGIMKRGFTLIIALSIAFAGFSQSCLPEGIEFSTQAQIDSFQVNYPNCTEIEGGVVIYTSDWSDITNLSGLSVLTSIGGNLEIINYDFGTNSNLYSLVGLEGLTEIGGDLLICNNSALATLTGLDNLISIGGSLYIGNDEYGGNINLSNLTGLESLTNIGGDLNFSNNDSLATLTGLDNLTAIGGSLGIVGNPALMNITNLGNLSGIGWNLYIDTNSSLTSLTGLDNLSSIGYNILIANNPSLTSLSGLQNINPATIVDLAIFDNSSLSDCSVQCICDYLAAPNGSIQIDNNASGCANPPEVANDCGISLPCLPFGNYYFNSQSDIDNFHTDYPDCTELQGDVFISGDDITNLYGLYGVTSFEDMLWVVNTTALTSLNGLDQVDYVGGDFLIQGNDALSNLAGLGTLDTVMGRLQINYNDSLTNFSGMYPLKFIGNDFEIRNNGALNSLNALNNLSYIGGHLQISNNYSLSNLMGLDVLDSIGGYLMINSNNQLISLFGLTHLSSIGGVLFINGNNYLGNIGAIKNIEAASITDLYIYFNLSLSTCEIQSVCDYLTSPNGTVEIHDNATGCNSQQEVEAACGVGIDDHASPESQIALSPNPASTAITISLPSITPIDNTTLSIYNVNAQKVILSRITESQTVVDISTLPRGVYFARITTDATVMVSKFIKQ